MIRVVGIICLLLCLTSCSSWVEIKRNEQGLIERLEYSGNQEWKITPDGSCEANNKVESPFKDLINIGMKTGG